MSSERKKIKLKYNVQIEVTRNQYRKLTKHFPGAIAHRRDLETGKYYIKLWNMRQKERIEKIL